MVDGLERIGVHLPSLLIHLVDFLLLLAFLYVVAYRPLMRAASKRASGVEQMERDVAEAKRLRDEATQESAALRQTAKQEAGRRLGEAAAEGRERGNREAQAAMERAAARIDAAEQEALQRVIDVSQDMVLLAAEKVVGRSLDREAHVELVRSAVEEATDLLLRSEGRRKVVRIVTAVPLTDAEWKALTDDVAATLGQDVLSVRETDSTLLGGATVVAGDTAVDASLSGHLHALHRHLRSAPPPSAAD